MKVYSMGVYCDCCKWYVAEIPSSCIKDSHIMGYPDQCQAIGNQRKANPHLSEPGLELIDSPIDINKGNDCGWFERKEI